MILFIQNYIVTIYISLEKAYVLSLRFINIYNYINNIFASNHIITTLLFISIFNNTVSIKMIKNTNLLINEKNKK